MPECILASHLLKKPFRVAKDREYYYYKQTKTPTEIIAQSKHFYKRNPNVFCHLFLFVRA